MDKTNSTSKIEIKKTSDYKSRSHHRVSDI